MINIFQPFGFALLSLLLLGLPSELNAETQEPSKVIECSFLHWDDIPEEKFYFRVGEEYHPMEFRQGKRSIKISLKRMDAFEVFREAKNPIEGQPPYEFLTKAAIPAGATELMFFMISPEGEVEGEVEYEDEDEDEGEDQYRVIALDDSVEVFPRRTFRFFNLTEQVISVEFAGETQEVPVNGNAVIQSRVDKKGGFIPCIMRDPEGKMIFGTRLFAQPNGRELVLIRPSLREGRNAPRVKFFAQLVAPAPVNTE